jgi:hypothetical protein
MRIPNRRIGKSPAQRFASGWFSARNTAGLPREVSVAAEVAGESLPENWLSAADEGWNIVETVSRSEHYAYTEDGLPVRERGAHLMPGSANLVNAGARRPIERDPSHTRMRLSSFQQGISKAKEVDGEEKPARTSGWKALGRKE